MPFLTGIWGYVGAAIIAAFLATSATYYVISEGYKLEISRLQKAAVQHQADESAASLKKLNDYIAGINASAQAYESDRSVLIAKLNQLDKEFSNATKANPLPPDCRPDDERMRQLTAAIDAANAAAAGSGFGATLRTPSTAEQP